MYIFPKIFRHQYSFGFYFVPFEWKFHCRCLRYTSLIYSVDYQLAIGPFNFYFVRYIPLQLATPKEVNG